ncbi:DUF493 domain-containing protein [archaeon]|nr:MAG: DUF493 domain-containing protein [archaeon]
MRLLLIIMLLHTGSSLYVGRKMLIRGVAANGRFLASRLASSAVFMHQYQKPKSNGTGFGSPNRAISLPSIDELAKQQQLRVQLQQYRDSSTQRTVFDDTVKFPTEFTLKVIGTNDLTFLPDVLRIVGECVDKPASSIRHSVKEASSGSYLSITLTCVFKSASQLYNTYEIVGKDKRVKYVL